MSDMLASDYTSENIHLKDADHIRHRPGMYIGDTGERRLYYLLNALLLNSAEESWLGACHNLRVELLADGGCRVADDGRGILVRTIDRSGVPFVELAFTRHGPTIYRVNPQLLVNALSRRLEVIVRRDDRLWRQEYERGRAVTPLRDVGATDTTGTEITFWPDPEIFQSHPTFSFTIIRERLRELACVSTGLCVSLRDEQVDPALAWSYHAPNGLADWLGRHTRGGVPIHSEIVHGKESTSSHHVEFACCWVRGDQEYLVGLVNGERVDQGTHVQGVLRGVSQAFRPSVRPRVVRPSGIVAAVAVRIEEPMFTCQAKKRLLNPEIESVVASLTRRTLESWLVDYEQSAQAIIAHLRDPKAVDARSGV